MHGGFVFKDIAMFNTTYYEDKIPSLVLEALVGWGKQERPVGDFLTAFLSNDLKMAIARADEDSLATFRDIMLFMVNEMPSQCHGSREKVAAWAKEIQQYA